MNAARITRLAPSTYRRTPWKNGGGVTIDIAWASRAGCETGGWSGMLWRFGRTAIQTEAPFSDLGGFDRLQMVVAGRGLVLQTPTSEIDLREPLVAVRFAGETPIVSRLEAGPVEVVNLIADRSYAAIDLVLLAAGIPRQLGRGIHVCYASHEACTARCNGVVHDLAAGHALQIECDDAIVIEVVLGCALIASILPFQ
jgi:environmental stress-induced protein Ves